MTGRWLSGWLSRLRFNPAHPSFRQLVDWNEGELSEKWMDWTSRHVLACPLCRRQVLMIRRARSRAAEELATGADSQRIEAGALRLLRRLSNLAAVESARKTWRRQDELRLATALKPFLGACPERLVSVSGQSEASNSRVFEAAEIFLGKHAAESLSGLWDVRAEMP